MVGIGNLKFKVSVKNRIICDWFMYCITRVLPYELFGESNWYEKAMYAHSMMMMGKALSIKGAGAPDDIHWEKLKATIDEDRAGETPISKEWLWEKMYPGRWQRWERQKNVEENLLDKEEFVKGLESVKAVKRA